MNRKKTGKIFISLGILLIFAAASLFAFNMHLQKKGEENRKKVMEHLLEEIDNNQTDENIVKPIDSIVDDKERTINDSVIVDGILYIGYISIPSLDIEMPVSKEWDGSLLNMGACRYKGSTYQDDLVVCAHNYYTYFANIYKLSGGDEVIFTDIYGEKITYIVSYQEVVNGKDIKGMITKSDDWDLTLFTCTMSGLTRTTVRCKRK